MSELLSQAAGTTRDVTGLDASFDSADKFAVKVPSLSDTANIQKAFALYHYGIESAGGSGEISPTSVYSYFSTLTTRVTDLENTPSGGGIVTTVVPFDVEKADSSLTVLPEGYIWVDEDGVVESILASGAATYTPNKPANPTHGQVWVDSDDKILVLLGKESTILDDLQEQINQVEALALLGI